MDSNKVQGEGDYQAAKEYDEATEQFVKSGKVGAAAKAAAPQNAAVAAELLQAEEEGKKHAKGEDRLLQKGAKPDPAAR